MKIYDESKIKPNDPLREQKIEALANIEELNKDLKRDSGVIEKYIPIIIQEACGSEEDLIEKIINGQSEEEIKIIEVKINEALKRHGWELNSYKRKEEGDKLLARLKNDLVKFDEAVPEIYHAYDDGDYYFVKTAINMMRDSLLVNIRDCEARIEKSQGDSEQQKKDKKASQEGEKSSSVVVNGSVFMLNKTKHFGSTLTIETFREELEREINQVKNQNASTANSSDTSDGYSEVSSETDNSSVGSADNHNDNKKPFDRNKPEFAASSSDEIYDIGMETKIAIRMKRKIKQKNVDLDAILEETGEEEALELEAKNKVLAAELETISELEYNEEEQQFLAGQITDQQKKEEIAQRIEAKLLKKNNKVGFEKKVKQIKQEIKNAENNSNLHVQQAFKHAKNKAEALLRDLESITSDNSNPAKNNNFPTS
ncbi:1809_t:CDS:2 [Funneliformis geosporum]|uniref:1809_t:CDS:1 n=1 Tax=Funneliformis geosporum TaxID=1117311 RepID=A0A9W4SS67_9GLOM|nr:1809_t:CDS:2 [Funneliformis geosporum]